MKLRTTPRPYQQTTRAQAAEATRERLVDAFLARLMAQWFDEITLEQVAADAGVTVMTVVRRFGGKDGLLAAGARRMSQKITERRAAQPGDVAGLLAGLLADYEETGDAVIRLLALETRYASVRACVEFGRAEHRRWVAQGFSPGMAGLAGPARERALDALVICTDVYTWKLLRRDNRRSLEETTRIVKGMIENTLKGLRNFEG